MSHGKTLVGDVMNSEVHTLGRNDWLVIADDLMQQARIRHLPVLDGEKLVGILTEGDFVRLAAP